MYITVLAVVLRAENYRDNDKMLTLFSGEKGKIEALSRGCRKQGSHLAAASEPFVCSEMQLYEKNGRYTLTQAVVKDDFYEMRSDLDRFYCGSILLAATERCTVPESPDRRVFALLINYLYGLTKGADPMDVLLFFSFRLMYALGQGLSLGNCIYCMEPSVVKIDFDHGGCVCADCQGGVEFSERFISILRLIYSSGVKDIADAVYGADRSETLKFLRYAFDTVNIGHIKAVDYFDDEHR